MAAISRTENIHIIYTRRLVDIATDIIYFVEKLTIENMLLLKFQKYDRLSI